MYAPTTINNIPAKPYMLGTSSKTTKPTNIRKIGVKLKNGTVFAKPERCMDFMYRILPNTFKITKMTRYKHNDQENTGSLIKNNVAIVNGKSNNNCANPINVAEYFALYEFTTVFNDASFKAEKSPRIIPIKFMIFMCLF
jgi:hypothetical protein